MHGVNLWPSCSHSVTREREKKERASRRATNSLARKPYNSWKCVSGTEYLFYEQHTTYWRVVPGTEYFMNTKRLFFFFNLNINQLDALNFIMSLFYASTCSSICAHLQEVKIVLYSLWYHHTYRWLSGAQVESGLSQPVHGTAGAQVESGLSQPVHGTATYRCDYTRDCIVQFWLPDDEHMCSKHVDVWNKLIIKFSASSWLILR